MPLDHMGVKPDLLTATTGFACLEDRAALTQLHAGGCTRVSCSIATCKEARHNFLCSMATYTVLLMDDFAGEVLDATKECMRSVQSIPGI